MAIKSTQIIAIRATRGGAPVTGFCRIIKYEHRKDDPASEGVPQREVLLLNASGKLVVRITKFFRHLLVECDGAFETTDKVLQLTPANVQLLAEEVLLAPNHRQQILTTALSRIEWLHSRASADEDDSEE